MIYSPDGLMRYNNGKIAIVDDIPPASQWIKKSTCFHKSIFLKADPNFDTNAPPFDVRGCKLGLGGCKQLRSIKIFAEKFLCFGNTYNLKHIFATIVSKNNISTSGISISVAAHSH